MINYPSSIGLILDIIGVLLLFRFGLPSKHKEPNKLAISSTNHEQKEREKFNRKLKIGAYVGLSFILAGFILQLIGTNIQCFPK